jgi:TRAP-type C4-dicarboxylate transport system permease small subunit
LKNPGVLKITGLLLIALGSFLSLNLTIYWFKEHPTFSEILNPILFLSGIPLLLGAVLIAKGRSRSPQTKSVVRLPAKIHRALQALAWIIISIGSIFGVLATAMSIKESSSLQGWLLGLKYFAMPILGFGVFMLTLLHFIRSQSNDSSLQA